MPHRKAYLRTVDSDVVVRAVHHFSQMYFTELWIGFGSGLNFKEIAVHEMQRLL